MLSRALKWGNSLAFRIPKPVAKECGIKENTPLEISSREGEIIITPVKNKYSLDELLAKVTKKNIHSEIEFGQPAGKEIL